MQRHKICSYKLDLKHTLLVIKFMCFLQIYYLSQTMQCYDNTVNINSRKADSSSQLSCYCCKTHHTLGNIPAEC